MIVESPEVIPRQKDNCRVPVWPLHHGIELSYSPVLAFASAEWRMFIGATCGQPAHGRQVSVQGIAGELIVRHHSFIPKWTVSDMPYSIQRGKLVAILALRGRIVLPGDVSCFHRVGQSLKIKAWWLGGDPSIFLLYRYCLVLIRVTAPIPIAGMRIIQDSSRLSSHRIEVIGK